MPKIVNFTSFWKSEACGQTGQTVLPDWSTLIGQELLKNAIFEKKIENLQILISKRANIYELWKAKKITPKGVKLHQRLKLRQKV